jgi:hypothetical protein
MVTSRVRLFSSLATPITTLALPSTSRAFSARYGGNVIQVPYNFGQEGHRLSFADAP